MNPPIAGFIVVFSVLGGGTLWAMTLGWAAFVTNRMRKRGNRAWIVMMGALGLLAATFGALIAAFVLVPTAVQFVVLPALFAVAWLAIGALVAILAVYVRGFAAQPLVLLAVGVIASCLAMAWPGQLLDPSYAQFQTGSGGGTTAFAEFIVRFAIAFAVSTAMGCWALAVLLAATGRVRPRAVERVRPTIGS